MEELSLRQSSQAHPAYDLILAILDTPVTPDVSSPGAEASIAAQRSEAQSILSALTSGCAERLDTFERGLQSKYTNVQQLLVELEQIWTAHGGVSGRVIGTSASVAVRTSSSVMAVHTVGRHIVQGVFKKADGFLNGSRASDIVNRRQAAAVLNRIAVLLTETLQAQQRLQSQVDEMKSASENMEADNKALYGEVVQQRCTIEALCKELAGEGAKLMEALSEVHQNKIHFEESAEAERLRQVKKDEAWTKEVLALQQKVALMEVEKKSMKASSDAMQASHQEELAAMAEKHKLEQQAVMAAQKTLAETASTASDKLTALEQQLEAVQQDHDRHAADVKKAKAAHQADVAAMQAERDSFRIAAEEKIVNLELKVATINPEELAHLDDFKAASKANAQEQSPTNSQDPETPSSVYGQRSESLSTGDDSCTPAQFTQAKVSNIAAAEQVEEAESATAIETGSVQEDAAKTRKTKKPKPAQAADQHQAAGSSLAIHSPQAASTPPLVEQDEEAAKAAAKRAKKQRQKAKRQQGSVPQAAEDDSTPEPLPTEAAGVQGLKFAETPVQGLESAPSASHYLVKAPADQSAVPKTLEDPIMLHSSHNLLPTAEPASTSGSQLVAKSHARDLTAKESARHISVWGQPLNKRLETLSTSDDFPAPTAKTQVAFIAKMALQKQSLPHFAPHATVPEDCWEACPFNGALGEYRWPKDKRSLVGGGGTAQVYWAERSSGPGDKGERVAVKCVEGTIPRDIVEQEAIMLTQLQRVRRTTCIPPFYGVHMAEQDQTDAPSYLIMGLVAGKDLMSICIAVHQAAKGMAAGPELQTLKAWLWQFQLHVTRCMLEAFSRLHSKGFYHRDVKPDNIMITGWDGPKVQCKLIDWAAGRNKDQKGRPNQMFTAEYASPQIIAHLHDPWSCPCMPDQPNDTWALGVSLHQVLTCMSITWEPAFGCMTGQQDDAESMRQAQTAFASRQTEWAAVHEGYSPFLDSVPKAARTHPIVKAVYEAADFASADQKTAVQAEGMAKLLCGLLHPERSAAPGKPNTKRILAIDALEDTKSWLSEEQLSILPDCPVPL